MSSKLAPTTTDLKKDPSQLQAGGTAPSMLPPEFALKASEEKEEEKPASQLKEEEVEKEKKKKSKI